MAGVHEAPLLATTSLGVALTTRGPHAGHGRPEESDRLKEMSKGVVALAAFLCVAGYVFVYASGRAQQPIRSDGFSYYVYLPSWFLFQDLTLRDLARDCCGGEFPAFTAIIRWPDTRRWVNAHPIGVAILQAPFFLIAHALTRWTNLAP